jgi:alkyldihydroxyacetonephosphate synthase
MIQAKLPLSMLRLSTAVETETTLALAGHERLIATLEQLMSIRSVADEKAMLMAVFSGQERIVKTTRKEAFAIARQHGGIHVGKQFGKQWHKSRFHTPYLRNTLWEAGYAVDTLETAVPWNKINGLIQNIETGIKASFAANNEQVHVFTHLSHIYADGASIYCTYLFKLAPDSEETIQQWRAAKEAASQAILNAHGTISHQHGVGLDHIPYLVAEKKELGLAVIGDAIRRFDPRGIMNPGKLIQ